MTEQTTTTAIATRRIETLRGHLRDQGFLSEPEGQELLGGLSQLAETKVKEGQRSFTEAFIYLNEIRLGKLYEFASYKSFEQFLQRWLDNCNLSRTTAWYGMKAVMLWSGIGRRPEDLLEIEGGTGAIRPLLESIDDKIVADIDMQTGEVTSLADDWQEILSARYPQATTPTEMAAFWVQENISEMDTGRTVRAALRTDKGKNGTGKKDKIRYRVQRNEKGHVINFSWELSRADGTSDRGIGLASMNTKMRMHVLRHTLSLLGIKQLESE